MNRVHPFLYIALMVVGFLGCTESVGPADPNGRSTLPGISGGGGGGTSTHQVTVGDNFFSPASVTIAVNDTVTWVWSGSNSHSVTFDDGGHDSGVKSTGTYQRFFGTAGTFRYSSTVLADSLMVGTVTVQ